MGEPRLSAQLSRGVRQFSAYDRGAALFRVSSGGNDYWLFFSYYTVNDKDHANVGIYGMGVAPRTERKTSGPEGVFFSWFGSVSDLHVNGAPGIYIPDDDNTEFSDRMMDEIVEDLNTQDNAGLREKFTDDALAQHPKALDGEIDELFALFPDGDIAWEELTQEPDVRLATEGDDQTILLLPTYRVTSGGTDQWLSFADFTVNTIDPDNLGLYAIGVAPRTESRDSPQEQALFAWAGSFDVKNSIPPAIFIPE